MTNLGSDCVLRLNNMRGLAGCTLAQFALQPCDRMEFPKWFNSLAVIGGGGLAGLHGFQGETPPSVFLPKIGGGASGGANADGRRKMTL